MLLWIYHSQSCHISHPQVTPTPFVSISGFAYHHSGAETSLLSQGMSRSLLSMKGILSLLWPVGSLPRKIVHMWKPPEATPLTLTPAFPSNRLQISAALFWFSELDYVMRRVRMSQFLQNNGPLWSFKTGSVAADVTESVQRSWAAFPLTSQLSPLSSLFVYEAQRVRRSWHWCLRERSP